MSHKPYLLDRYVLDTLMRDLVGHDRRPSAFLVYLTLWGARETGAVRLSHAQIAERAGLSKRSAQDALRHLSGRGLIHATRTGVTEITAYEVVTPWRPAARP